MYERCYPCNKGVVLTIFLQGYHFPADEHSFQTVIASDPYLGSHVKAVTIVPLYLFREYYALTNRYHKSSKKLRQEKSTQHLPWFFHWKQLHKTTLRMHDNI